MTMRSLTVGELRAALANTGDKVSFRIDTGASIFAASDPKPSFAGFTVSIDMSCPAEDERDELLERLFDAAQHDQKARRLARLPSGTVHEEASHAKQIEAAADLDRAIDALREWEKTHG